MQGATNVKNQRARQLPYSEYECDAHERGIKILTARIAKVAQSSLREPRLNCRRSNKHVIQVELYSSPATSGTNRQPSNLCTIGRPPSLITSCNSCASGGPTGITMRPSSPSWSICASDISTVAAE